MFRCHYNFLGEALDEEEFGLKCHTTGLVSGLGFPCKHGAFRCHAFGAFDSQQGVRVDWKSTQDTRCCFPSSLHHNRHAAYRTYLGTRRERKFNKTGCALLVLVRLIVTCLARTHKYLRTSHDPMRFATVLHILVDITPWGCCHKAAWALVLQLVSTGHGTSKQGMQWV